MPKGVTKLLSDGAAKRKDPGVAMPRKTPTLAQVKARESGRAIDQNEEANEKVERKTAAVPRDVVGARNISDAIRQRDGRVFGGYEKRGGMAHTLEKRPNAANTRARAAGSLLDRLPKMPKGKKK